MTHCYYMAFDNTFWQKFKSGCPYPILHFDSNKNIKFNPKHEAQNANFSGRQHTLHCGVLLDNENGIVTNQFVFHLSDNTTHDSVINLSIIENILEAYPQIVVSGHIIIPSDNCSMQ